MAWRCALENLPTIKKYWLKDTRSRNVEDIKFNPLFGDFFEADHSRKFFKFPIMELCKRSNYAGQLVEDEIFHGFLYNDTASWRQMYVTSPPVSQLEFHLLPLVPGPWSKWHRVQAKMPGGVTLGEIVDALRPRLYRTAPLCVVFEGQKSWSVADN